MEKDERGSNNFDEENFDEDDSYSNLSKGTKTKLGNLKSGKWTEQEDQTLKETIERYGAKNWKKIWRFVPGRTSIQCLHRWTKILKPGLIKGPWNVKEDQLLKKWVAENGPCRWSEATKIITGRSGKQIRERWFNTLNPTLKKGNWNNIEEQILIKLVMRFGSKWSKLVQFFEGRTENSIKNRLYWILRKVANEKRKSGDIDPKFLDPEGKELQCSTDDLLLFMSDALESYKPPLYELPEDIDIDNPRLLAASNQKRAKTESNNEIQSFSYFPEQNWGITLPANEPPKKTRSRLNPNGIAYDPTLQSRAFGYDYNPAKDVPSHAKFSPHLNELSHNLNSQRNLNFETFPTSRIIDPMSSMNIAPLRHEIHKATLPPLQISQYDQNVNNSCTNIHTSRITSNNDNGRRHFIFINLKLLWYLASNCIIFPIFII